MEVNRNPLIDNSIFLAIDSPRYEPRAYQCLQYIAECLDAQVPFSQIILSSREELGSYIHPQSFASALEMLKTRMGPQIYHIIQNTDDIQMYAYNNVDAIPELEKGFDVRYYKVLQNSLETSGSAAATVTKNDPEISSPAVSTTSSAELDPDHYSESDPDYSSESDSDQTEVSNSSNNSQSDSSEMSNSKNSPYYHEPVPPENPVQKEVPDGLDSSTNTQNIVIYTIIAFVAIQVLAWYVRTYHKESMVQESLDPPEQETVLTSIYENTIFVHSIFIDILLALIPWWIIWFFQLRFYYLSKIKALFKFK